MSSSYSVTATDSFTILHARSLASKVATDLQKFHRFYEGGPTLERIARYEQELVVLLKYKALVNVTYGFQRNGKWTEAAVKYNALPDGTLSSNDDPGKIRPGLDVTGATFMSFLESDESHLTDAQKAALKNELPFERSGTETPQLEQGYWGNDLNYAAGGRGLGRATPKK